MTTKPLDMEALRAAFDYMMTFSVEQQRTLQARMAELDAEVELHRVALALGTADAEGVAIVSEHEHITRRLSTWAQDKAVALRTVRKLLQMPNGGPSRRDGAMLVAHLMERFSAVEIAAIFGWPAAKVVAVANGVSSDFPETQNGL